jgi:hypothetical protein
MKQEISSNELLEVQIKNNNKILVSENLESTHTKGNFELAEPFANLTAKITFPDGHFTSYGFRKDNNNYSVNVKFGNDDFSKEIFIVISHVSNGYQYRITLLNIMREVA